MDSAASHRDNTPPREPQRASEHAPERRAPSEQAKTNAETAKRETEKKRWGTLRPLRTYKDDVAEAMGTRKSSLVSIAASEEKRRSKERSLTQRVKTLQEQIEKEGTKIRKLEEEEGAQKPAEPRLQPKREHFPKPPHEPSRDIPKPPHVPRTAPPPPHLPTEQVAARATQQKQTAPPASSLEQKKQELMRLKREQEKRRPARVATTERVPLGRRAFAIFGISVVLLGASGTAGWFAYRVYQQRGAVEPELQAPTLVRPNVQEEIAWEGSSASDLMSILRDAGRDVSAPPGSIVQLYVTEGADGAVMSAERFITLLAPQTPGRLARSLEDVFTFGFHTAAQTEPFLVFNTTFFENAFAGMLEWEPTMVTDLAPLFGAASATAPRSGNSAASSSSFVDVVVANKDTRTLYDEAGDVALLYSFIDKDTLIVAPSTNTFLEVFNRITSSRIVR